MHLIFRPKRTCMPDFQNVPNALETGEYRNELNCIAE
nr:MAG TPA: hypothetical protein [Caudoviricetes sp.]